MLTFIKSYTNDPKFITSLLYGDNCVIHIIKFFTEENKVELHYKYTPEDTETMTYEEFQRRFRVRDLLHDYKEEYFRDLSLSF